MHKMLFVFINYWLNCIRGVRKCDQTRKIRKKVKNLKFQTCFLRRETLESELCILIGWDEKVQTCKFHFSQSDCRIQSPEPPPKENTLEISEVWSPFITLQAWSLLRTPLIIMNLFEILTVLLAHLRNLCCANNYETKWRLLALVLQPKFKWELDSIWSSFIKKAIGLL